MPTAATLPDVELMVRTLLVDTAAIASLVGTDERGEVRVYTVIPKPAPSTPFLRVIRLGGVDRPRRAVGLPVVQFDAYGGTKAQARELLAAVYVALEAAEAAGTIAGGYVQGTIPGASRYLPDPDLMTERNAARERYVGDAQITTRPARS